MTSHKKKHKRAKAKAKASSVGVPPSGGSLAGASAPRPSGSTLVEARQGVRQAVLRPETQLRDAAYPIYHLNGVCKAFYNSTGECVAHGCKDISLDIQRGEFVAITGESGSGVIDVAQFAGLFGDAESGTFGGAIFVLRGTGST
ncbi:MAG: hypothetical protein EOL87_12865 [Spartobacteria bacterium]|nr:hypothetical protein [Spartobacteria bacterium]